MSHGQGSVCETGMSSLLLPGPPMVVEPARYAQQPAHRSLPIVEDAGGPTRGAPYPSPRPLTASCHVAQSPVCTAIGIASRWSLWSRSQLRGESGGILLTCRHWMWLDRALRHSHRAKRENVTVAHRARTAMAASRAPLLASGLTPNSASIQWAHTSTRTNARPLRKAPAVSTHPRSFIPRPRPSVVTTHPRSFHRGPVCVARIFWP